MSAETDVRNYLQFLKDPTSLRDENKISSAQEQVRSATDPIDQLKAIADLERAQEVDGESLRQSFVASAKQWAESEGVPVTAFRDLGVPTDVLRDAGFRVPRGRRSGGTAARQTRSGRVTTEDVKEAARGMDGVFTAAELQETSGASPGTIRKVIREMTRDGELQDLGTDPDYGGRGRAPKRYQT